MNNSNKNQLIFNISKNENYYLYNKFTSDFIKNNIYNENQINNIKYLIKK